MVLPPPENPCKPLACDIQACIQRNQYQQERCDHLGRKLYECCAAYYERHGRDKACVSCPRPDKVDQKMAQWRSEA